MYKLYGHAFCPKPLVYRNLYLWNKDKQAGKKYLGLFLAVLYYTFMSCTLTWFTYAVTCGVVCVLCSGTWSLIFVIFSANNSLELNYCNVNISVWIGNCDSRYYIPVTITVTLQLQYAYAAGPFHCKSSYVVKFLMHLYSLCVANLQIFQQMINMRFCFCLSFLSPCII